MMDKRHLEVRVAGLVNHVLSGGLIEDDYVECKSRLSDNFRKTARQIAGLCNAARGEDALWIVGIDEDAHKLVEGYGRESADWWPRIERCFDEGVAPALDIVHIQLPQGAVTAMSFTTDRAPYVIKGDGQSVDREVPWRGANSTRSATRLELLSLLVPSIATPELELIDPKVKLQVAGAVNHESGVTSLTYAEDRGNARFAAQMFISAAPSDRVMLPKHRWTISVTSPEWDAEGWGAVEPTLRASRLGIDDDGLGVRVLDHSGIFVNGSGRVALIADLADSPSWTPNHARTLQHQAELTVAITMPVDRHHRAAHATATLRYRAMADGTAWQVARSH